MRFFGYPRVSSIGQDKRDTIEKQIYDLTKFCEHNGHTLVQMFPERAVSGATDFDERPAMIALLDALKASPEAVDGILFFQLDRLARDLIVQEKFIVDFIAAYPDKKIISIMEGDMTDPDPGRVMFRQMIGSLSQYEKSTIRLRITGGKLRKARKGGWNGGAVPYGYRAIEGHLSVDTQEASVVRLIFKLRKGGMSLHDIAYHLDSKGIPGPKNKKKPEGGLWNHGTVYYILNNKIYQGQAAFNGVVVERPELALVEKQPSRGETALIAMGV